MMPAMILRFPGLVRRGTPKVKYILSGNATRALILPALHYYRGTRTGIILGLWKARSTSTS